MKTKKTILTLFALFACILGISAENSIAVNGALVTKGKTGSINIELVNPDDAFCAFQMDLVLPDGLTFVSASKGARITSAHSLGQAALGGNIIRFSSIDMEQNREYLGESGTLFTVTVSVSDALTVGDVLTAQLQNVEFARRNESQFKIAQQNFSIEITDKVVIDENSAALPSVQNGVDVLVKRTIKKNVWNTICLPFDMDATQTKQVFGDDVQVAEFIDYKLDESDKIIVNFEEIDLDNYGFSSNYPYLIKTTRDITDFTVEGVDVTTNEENAVAEYSEGKGSKKVVYGRFFGTLRANTVLDPDFLFLNNNKFYYSTGSTIIKGLRGYFKLKDFVSSTGGANLVMSFDGSTNHVNDVKVVVNEDGVYYNLKGQRVDNPTGKGIYIKNGKKIVK